MSDNLCKSCAKDCEIIGVRQCAEYSPRTNTNADRIRSMNDEELRTFIDRCENLGYSDKSVAGELDVIDWLKQPAAESEGK